MPKRKITTKTQRPPPDPSAIKSAGFTIPTNPIKTRIKDTRRIRPVFPNEDLQSVANTLNYDFPFYIFSTVPEQNSTAHHF